MPVFHLVLLENTATNMDFKVILFSALLCIATVSGRGYSPGAKKLLDTLWRMQGRNIISGLFGGYTGVGDSSKFNLDHIRKIQSWTKKTPAIYGLDCSHGWDTTPPYKETDIINCYHPDAVEFGKKWGGIVAISHHLPNPVFEGNRNKQGQGAFKTGISNWDYRAIVGPQRSPQRDRWFNMMKKIADGLKAYKGNGITVLYRPLHEMNGDWFWWGAEVGKGWDKERQDLYKKLWVDLWNYMNGQGLDNLVWVWSPDKTREPRNAWYPGDQYVDVVALDAYSDDPWDKQIGEAYNEVTRINKPFGFAEIGPKWVDEAHGDNYAKSNLDYKKMVDVMATKYTKTTFFVPWNRQWSPTNNIDAHGAYNHPKVKNMGEF